MRTARLPTVHVLVATTSCQCWCVCGGGAEGRLGPQVNKIEQVSSDDQQMSVIREEDRSPGLMSYHLTYPMIHVVYLLACEQTDAYEQTDACKNITFQ